MSPTSFLEDRANLNTIHGVQHTHQPGHTVPETSPWKRTPTLIATPFQMAMNPFSKSRMSSNFSSKTQQPIPQQCRTLKSTISPRLITDDTARNNGRKENRPAKKARLSSQLTVDVKPSHAPEDGYNPSASSSRNQSKKPQLPAAEEIMDISMDDGPSMLSVVADVDDPQLLAEDGPSTQKLRQRLHGKAVDANPIEEMTLLYPNEDDLRAAYSRPPVTTQSAPEIVISDASNERNVLASTSNDNGTKTLRTSHSKPSSRRTSSANQSTKPPQVDLIVERKRVAAMRGRGAPKLQLEDKMNTVSGRYKQISKVKAIDPHATSSTRFQTTHCKHKEMLIDSWYKDAEHINEDGHSLVCERADNAKVTFVVKQTKDNQTNIIYTLHMDSMKAVKVSNAPEEPVIQLCMLETKVGNRLKAGPMDNTTFTFRLHVEDHHSDQYIAFKDWIYDVLESQPKSIREVLSGTAACKCWEIAVRNADYLQSLPEEVQPGTSPDACTERQSSLEYRSNSPKRARAKPAYKGKQDQPASGARQTFVRKSVRQVGSAFRDPTPNTDEIILVYPHNGSGAVNICQSDVKRLQPGEFLNDTLIELGLKLWMNDLRGANPELADQIHVFSSFFYKKLNNKSVEDGYRSLRKWTAKIDIFKKKYIIIPINEHVHWYLAIIYQPEHVLEAPPLSVSIPTSIVRTRGQKRKSDGDECGTLDEPSLQVASNGAESHAVGACDGADESPVQDTDDAIDEVTRSTQDCSLDDEIMSPEGAVEGGGSNDFGSEEICDSEDERVTNAEDEVDMLLTDDPSIDASPETVIHTELPHPSRTSGSPISANVNNQTVDDSDELDLIGDSAAISTKRFYAPAKGKKESLSPTTESVSPTTVTDESCEVQGDDVVMLVDENGQQKSTTCIFTFDSLGSRHPQAIKLLKAYLRLEAEDKKHIFQTSEPVGKQAQVPVQPNYCDCGLYLLHFAKTFMSDPDKYCEMILTTKRMTLEEKQRVWKGEEVSSMREVMTGRIWQESELWKVKKSKDDEGKPKLSGDKAGQKGQESSDDDDIIVQGMTVPEKPTTRRGRKPLQPSHESHPAKEKPVRERLRG